MQSITHSIPAKFATLVSFAIAVEAPPRGTTRLVAPSKGPEGFSRSGMCRAVRAIFFDFLSIEGGGGANALHSAQRIAIVTRIGVTKKNVDRIGKSSESRLEI